MPAQADEIRPALLDIKQQNTGLYAVTWKVPKVGDGVLAVTARLPDSLELVGSPNLQDLPATRIERSQRSSQKSESRNATVRRLATLLR